MSSLTITFSKTGAGIENIVIEPDEEKNDGKSSFLYGEKAYFKVFADPDLELILKSTDGTLTDEGQGQEQVEEEITFLERAEQNTRKPCLSLTSYDWLGNSLASITKTGLFLIKCELTPEPAGDNGIGLARLKYNTQFKRYGIKVLEKPYDEYSVIVNITGMKG